MGSGRAAVFLLTVSLSACTGAAVSDAPPAGESTIPHGPLELTTGPLEPTRYKATGFAVPVSFEVGEGWTVLQQAERFFSLTRDDSVLSFGFLEDTSPDDLRRDLAGRKLEVSEPEAGDVGGLPSERSSVSAREQATVLYENDAGAYRIEPGNAATLTVVPLADGLLVITIQAPEPEIGAATGEVDFEVLATTTIDAEPAA